jgi:hypothetical protein
MDRPSRLLTALGFQTLDLLMEFVTPPQLTYTTSRCKMTSTTHGPSEASADGLGLPNT